MKITEYYKNCLEKGLEYQDFVTDILLNEIGVSLSNYSSKKFQLKGENKQGIEIKFDDLYKATNNIYIEIAEKSNANNENFVNSGIFRNDNTWLYVIGDYDYIFIFGKSFLINMYYSKRFKEIETMTSKGFLIPSDEAKKYCLKLIIIKDCEK